MKNGWRCCPFFLWVVGKDAMMLSPRKRRRATPEARPAEKPDRAPKARPTEKGNLREDKGGGERGSLPPVPPKRRGESHAGGAACGEKAMAVIQPHTEREKSRAKSATYGEEKGVVVTQPHT